MGQSYTIEPVSTANAHEVVSMVGQLLDEIIKAMDEQGLNFDQNRALAHLEEFLCHGHYFAFIAHEPSGVAIGAITLTESYALYAEGLFGTIPELYVQPDFRSHGVGLMLLERAKQFAAQRGWKRLEVTTPPLPEFDQTLAFYQREGFLISGGRKLRHII